MRETEQMHGRIRRYTSPDEHAFFARDLPPLVLPPIQYPEVTLLSLGVRWKLLRPGYAPLFRSKLACCATLALLLMQNLLQCSLTCSGATLKQSP